MGLILIMARVIMRQSWKSGSTSFPPGKDAYASEHPLKPKYFALCNVYFEEKSHITFTDRQDRIFQNKNHSLTRVNTIKQVVGLIKP